MKIHKFKPQRKRDTLLFKLLFLVAGIHVGALLIFGGMIISELVFQPETTFEAPPPPEKVEQKKQFQHKAKQQQQTSNKLVKRIQIPQAKMSGVSSANINLPSSDMAGTSLTGGLAPKGFGDLKITMTKVNLLGLSGNTQKIVIVIDASRYMMTDEKGALSTYNVIKDDIKKLINSLPGTVLFNVIAYSVPVAPAKGININAFNDGLISASEANKARLMDWLDPINSSLDKLEVSNNYALKFPFLPQAPTIRRKDGYNQEIAKLYKPYQAAVEQGADTVYILTSNWIAPNRIKKPLTEKDNEEYRQKVAKLKAQWDAAQKAAQAKTTEEEKAAAKEKGNAANEARAKKNAAAMQKAEDWLNTENEKRRKAGKSLNVSTARQIAIEKFGFEQGLAYRATPIFKAPAQDNNKPYSGEDIVKYYEKLLSEKKGEKVKIPVLNMILFKGKNENIVEQSRVSEAWVKQHKGNIKVLVGTEL